MKHISICILLALTFSTTQLAAQSENQSLIKLYINQKLTAEQSKEFAFKTASQYDDLLETIGILKYSNNTKIKPEALASSIKSLLVLNDFSDDEIIADMKIGTYIIFNKKQKISTQPLILQIAKNSPAYKSGLRPGDVLTHIDNFKFDSPKSRTQAYRILKMWPKDTPIKVKILRNKYNDFNPTSSGDKRIPKSFTMQLNK